MVGLVSEKSGKIGAVDALEYETDGESGTGVETGLPPLEEDIVDIFRSHEDLAVPFALNSKTEFACMDEGRGFSAIASCLQPSSGCSPVLGLEAIVRLALSGRVDDDRGQPIEFRFRNLVVGAEADLGRAAGVAGGIDVADGPWKLATGGALRLFDGGLASVACGLYPNARPIAATPTVPVAHNWPHEFGQPAERLYFVS